MDLVEIDIPIGPNLSDRLLDVLTELEVIDADYTDVDEAPTEPDGPARAYGLFETKLSNAHTKTLETRFGSQARLRTLPEMTTIALPDLGRRPVAFEGLTIVRGDAPAGPNRLAIEAHGAFGNGLHPTTALMLTRIARHPPKGRILDVGTGTGILALAALRLGAKAAVVTDIDPKAQSAATANAQANGLEDRWTMIRSLAEAVGPFETVLANIRAQPLMTLAASLSDHLDLGDTLWLSGIRAHELARVTSRFASHGLQVSDQHYAHGWTCIALTKGASSAGLRSAM